MKYIIILFVLFTVSVCSQDLEPTPFKFDWDGTGIAKVFEPDSFKQKEFLLGFQWSGRDNFNEALDNNALMGGTVGIDIYGNNPKKSMNSLIQTNSGLRAMMGLRYEPTLKINTDSLGYLQTRAGDKSNPVFGFKNIVGTILTDTTNANYSRLILETSIADTGKAKVLSDRWPKENFVTFPANPGSQYSEIYGKIWYLAINLKRVGTDNTYGNDTVLTIKLPIKKIIGGVPSIKSIVFSELPYNDTQQSHYIEMNGYSGGSTQYRGVYKAMTVKGTPNTDSLLAITKNMLPQSDSSITIFAKFITPTFTTGYNLPFPYKKNKNYIDSFDIEVEYYGNLGVAIDWIKVENIYSNIIHKGLIDNLGVNGNGDPNEYSLYPDFDRPSYEVRIKSILDGIQSTIDAVDNNIAGNGVQRSKLFRFAGMDTESSSLFFWIQQRYFNLVTNGMNVVRDNIKYDRLYDYYAKTSNRYVGVKISENEASIRSPFFRMSPVEPVDPAINASDDFIWLYQMGQPGYMNRPGDTWKDTLRSQYETEAWTSKPISGGGKFNFIRDYPINNTDDVRYLFDSVYHGGGFLQERWSEYTNYHTQLPEGKFFYFNDEPWWMNFFIGTNLGLYKDTSGFMATPTNGLDKYINIEYLRTKTGNDISLLTGHALLMGAKGFFYDRESEPSEKLEYTDDVLFSGLGYGWVKSIDPASDGNAADTSNQDYLNYLYDKEVGFDFIDSTIDVLHISDFINFDTTAKYMQVPKDRIYIGMRSIRTTIKKEHDWIRANDNELMDLHLQAYFSKEFKSWYMQNPDLNPTDTLIKKFIKIDSASYDNKYLYVYAKPLHQGIDEIFHHENFDSSFFDIALHKSVKYPLDSVFYIAVQNRRVDPLIAYHENGTSLDDIEMKFIPTAEMDDLIRYGDGTNNAEYWKQWYFKRLGTRKITIPFNYTYSDTNDYKLLKISEFDGLFKDSGGAILPDSLLPFWVQNDVYQKIDTVIGQDRKLEILLQPGETKFLKVEVLKPGIVEGFLDNYNETNLVGFPDATDSTKLVYHLVLYKNSKKPFDSTKTYKEVHYIQSMPIAKNSGEENIKWNPASRINLSRQFLETENPLGVNYVDCNHPALVVRNDSTGHPYAYVVYTCKDSSATNSDSARVVEAKVDALTGAIHSNKEIFKLSLNDIDRFGTPTINASAKGNFMAWTDSVRGMFVAYQLPSDDIPTVLDSITPYEFDAFTPGTLLYPSFNTYSDIAHGENNAGLVWYQLQTYIPYSGVFYTRIFYDDNTNKIEKVIPPNFSGYFGFTTGLNLKTVRLAETKMETKPTIYRDLNDYNDTSLAWCLYNRFDQINWIDTLYIPPPSVFAFSSNVINSLTLMHRDTNGYPEKWASTTINQYLFGSIFADIKINSINTAQSDGIILDTSKVQAGGNYNLDFTLDGQEIYQMPGYTKSTNFYDDTFGNLEIDYNRNKARKAAHGSNVQLAKTTKPNFNANGQMWKNRRVFETSGTDSLSNPYILSSGKLFYKTYANEVVNHGFYGFVGDSNNVYFDLPKLEGDLGAISTSPVNFGQIDPCGDIFQATNGVDTILTNTLIFPDYDNDGDREMQLSFYGYKNSKVKVYLRRELDSSLTLLTMPTTSDYPNNATKLIYSIIDSANSEFKLMFVNEDTTAHFNEKSFIYGMENSDTVSYKSAIQKDPVKYIIDFNNGGSQYVANHTNAIELKVYPNPTTGLVKVQAILPEEINNYKLKNRDVSVSIYNATGKLVVSKNGVSGQTLDFDLQNDPTGAYIINAEYNDDIHPLKATKNLVKQ